MLLFTNERLDFEPVGRFENVGNLQEPRGRFLIIDGQHRLAALHFYRSERPEEAASIHVPCVIFDGKSFVTEVLRGPKTFVKGEQDDLDAIIGKPRRPAP